MIPESDKYFANVFFVGGFALLSIAGGIILESVKISSMDLFNIGAIIVLIVSIFTGFACLYIGWYTLGHRELSYGRN